MAGTRKTFGRVDALLALLDYLGTAEGLDGVDISPTALSPLSVDESIFPGSITGQASTPVSAAGRTRTNDEFTIPFHICAENISAQEDGVAAMRRCEQLMTAVVDTLSSLAGLPSVPGVLKVVVEGNVEGPSPQLSAEPAGWAAYGTVSVLVQIRMI